MSRAALPVPCPTCYSDPGEPCRSPTTRRATKPHAARLTALAEREQRIDHTTNRIYDDVSMIVRIINQRGFTFGHADREDR